MTQTQGENRITFGCILIAVLVALATLVIALGVNHTPAPEAAATVAGYIFGSIIGVAGLLLALISAMLKPRGGG